MADEILLVEPTALKTCIKCSLEKPLTDFPRNRAQTDGYDRWCKSCHHEKNKAQYVLHREARREHSKQYREENAEKIAADNRAYREAHRDDLNEYIREWRKTHKANRSEESQEQHRQHNRERYANNPVYQEAVKISSKRNKAKKTKEELNAENKAWRDANPGKTREYYLRWKSNLTSEQLKELGIRTREKYKVSRRASNARYIAKRTGAPGELTNAHIYALHKWQDHCCFYCRENMKGHDTLDHVVPLAREGTNNPYNIVLACLNCNSFQKLDRLFFLDWTPKSVADAPRFHSSHGMSELKKMLVAEEIPFLEHPDHVQIRDRHIFILSSFWLGWRGDSFIKSIAESYDRPILIFDKELAAHPSALLNVIKAKAGISLKIGARKLIMAVPTVPEARDFIGQWHALGFASGTHYVGLRDSDRWWAIASFRKDVDRYEVVRMTFKDAVVGGVSRIIRHFRDEHSEGLPIVAFTDQRIGDGASHFPAGFKAAGKTVRSFFYATPEDTGFKPRRSFQKPVLAGSADFFDPQFTQRQLAQANGLMRVEGLPLLRFVLD